MIDDMTEAECCLNCKNFRTGKTKDGSKTIYVCSPIKDMKYMLGEHNNDDKKNRTVFELSHDRCSLYRRKYNSVEERFDALADISSRMLYFIKEIERRYPGMLDPNKQPGGQIVYPMPSERFEMQLDEIGLHADGEKRTYMQ